MSSSNEKVGLGNFGTVYPKEHHPEAAAEARAKIAAIAAKHEDVSKHEPALVTDKQQLAKTVHHHTKRTKRRRRIPSKVKPAITGIATFALLLLLFKAPLIISELSYIGHSSNAGATVSIPAYTAAVSSANTITIPKISVNAPVIYESSRDENQILKDLQSGVVHYGFTALPGQKGNAVIFGHSSNDWWEPGNYKFVFVLLDKLQPGDQFSVDYNSVRYVYQVTGSKVVEPTDLSVLNPTSTPTMTLITCTPPGTSWQRLVVTAKQILPNPDTAAPSTATVTTAKSTTPTSSSGIGHTISTDISYVWQGALSLFGVSQNSSSPQQIPAAD